MRGVISDVVAASFLKSHTLALSATRTSNISAHARTAAHRCRAASEQSLTPQPVRTPLSELEQNLPKKLQQADERPSARPCARSLKESEQRTVKRFEQIRGPDCTPHRGRAGTRGRGCEHADAAAATESHAARAHIWPERTASLYTRVRVSTHTCERLSHPLHTTTSVAAVHTCRIPSSPLASVPPFRVSYG